MKHVCAFALIGLSGSAMGQVIDGQITEAGYQLIWSHDLGTGFGDNRSEIDGVWAYCDATTLYLGVTGNLQDFNKLDLFFDSAAAAGQNQLRGDNADVDFNQLNTNLGGLTFDAGFEADYFLTYTINGDRNEHFTSAAQLNTLGGGPGGFQGGGARAGEGAQIIAGGANGFGYTVASDQTNAVGVAGFNNPPVSDPAQVRTGHEIAIPLSEIGYTGGLLRLAGFINGGAHDFLSNQVIGGLPAGTGNLGGDGFGNFTAGSVAGINFNNFAGDQFVTLKVPAPASAALLALGGLAVARRRR
jgi:hypothetical protein